MMGGGAAGDDNMITILVVEDNEMVRLLTKAKLGPHDAVSGNDQYGRIGDASGNGQRNRVPDEYRKQCDDYAGGGRTAGISGHGHTVRVGAVLRHGDDVHSLQRDRFLHPHVPGPGTAEHDGDDGIFDADRHRGQQRNPPGRYDQPVQDRDAPSGSSGGSREGEIKTHPHDDADDSALHASTGALHGQRSLDDAGNGAGHCGRPFGFHIDGHVPDAGPVHHDQ